MSIQWGRLNPDRPALVPWNVSRSPAAPAVRKRGRMMSWGTEEINTLAIGCVLVANLIVCGFLGVAALWWYRVGRVTHAGSGLRVGDDSGWSGPELVLAERFARGEIDDLEYRRSLETLRTASGGPRQPPLASDRPMERAPGFLDAQQLG
jgi:uncharacterized membrane protein